MRNPKWHRDEIILALDLYFKLEPGQIHGRNPEVIKLSDDLRKLPIYLDRLDEERFRNPNGVGLKLSNFLAIDPTYEGQGMSSFSKLDELIFNEFNDNRETLIRIANKIRSTINSDLALKIREEDEEEFQVREGKTLYKLHKYIERNSAIVRKKKQKVLKETGKLACEKCGFDFEETYGEVGKGFIECHHKRPLFEIEESETSFDDLILLCANCHRMEHRKMKNIV